MGKSVSEIYSEALKQKKYNTYIKRVGASLIDVLLVALIIVLAFFFLASRDGLIGTIARLAIPFIPIIYALAPHMQMANTIGRTLVAVIVVDKSSEENMPFKQALIRESLHIFSLLLAIASPFILSGSVFDNIWSLGEGVSIEWVVSALYLTVPLYIFWLLVEIVSMTFTSKNRAVQDFIANSIAVRQA